MHLKVHKHLLDLQKNELNLLFIHVHHWFLKSDTVDQEQNSQIGTV